MANESIAEWGIHKLAFALITKVDGVITAFGTPWMHPGAITLNTQPGNSNDNALSADNGRYYGGAAAQTMTGELTVAKFLNQYLTEVLGQEALDGGIGDGEGAGAEVAMLWETNADQGGTRYVWYDCTSTGITKNFQTTTYDGTVTYGTETATLTSTLAELPGGRKLRAWKCEKGNEHYDDFFNAVHVPTDTTPDAPKLSALTIGSLALTPAFDPDVTSYAATTTNATNTVTATAPLGATVTITANGTAVSSGDSVTWNEGENTVAVTVSNGTQSTSYTVTVTKE